MAIPSSHVWGNVVVYQNRKGEAVVPLPPLFVGNPFGVSLESIKRRAARRCPAATSPAISACVAWPPKDRGPPVHLPAGGSVAKPQIWSTWTVDASERITSLTNPLISGSQGVPLGHGTEQLSGAGQRGGHVRCVGLDALCVPSTHFLFLLNWAN